MSTSKRKLALFALAFLVVLILAGVGNAQENLNWSSHDFGSAIVFAQLLEDGEETLLMDGELKFAYPHGFQMQYYTLDGPVTITSQEGFIEVQSGNDAQYGYDRYWLFADIQNYLFALAEFSELDLQFSGIDEVAGCSARRYLATEDPNLVIWIHDRTGLPFLIREDKRTLVSISSYIIDPEDSEQIVSVELELLFQGEPALLTIERLEQGWVPVLLQVQEALGEVYIEFTNWSFSDHWVDSPLPRLAQIRELNDRFLVEFEEEKWEATLTTTQELLNIAPQFWQAYLYQAFVYEALGNYLGVVENYQQVLMRQPDNSLALNNLAYHYFLREVQIVQALEMAERAVALERRDIYLDTLGYGYYLVGRLEEAKELFEEALITAPEEAIEEITAHLNLVLEALGEVTADE